jgi:D-alanyl-D-alanine carboxypeptidase
MRSIHWIVLLSAALLLPQSCNKLEIGSSSDCSYTQPLNHPKAAAYQAVLNAYTAKGLPGITALIRDDQGLWVGTAGWADLDARIPMRSCTVSKGASTTKTFVEVLTLLLAEEGKLSLTDPLEKWLPGEVVEKVKNVRGSTIRRLLDHTTGIADVIEDNDFYLAVLNDPPHKWKPEELIKFVYHDDPLFPVGTDVEYSNTNYLLLAMVLDKVTGGDHSAALRTKVLEPLGLENTYYYPHDDLPAETAQGYFDLYNNGTILNLTNYNTGSGNGYGGIYSTVFDLQTLIEALVREKRVLKPETLNQMFSFTKPDDGYNRENGLGIFRDFLERAPTEFAYGHRGRDLGYTADMYWFPNQDFTITYLINYGTDAKSDLRPVFLDFRKEIVDVMME